MPILTLRQMRQSPRANSATRTLTVTLLSKTTTNSILSSGSAKSFRMPARHSAILRSRSFSMRTGNPLPLSRLSNNGNYVALSWRRISGKECVTGCYNDISLFRTPKSAAPNNCVSLSPPLEPMDLIAHGKRVRSKSTAVGHLSGTEILWLPSDTSLGTFPSKKTCTTFRCVRELQMARDSTRRCGQGTGGGVRRFVQLNLPNTLTTALTRILTTL